MYSVQFHGELSDDCDGLFEDKSDFNLQISFDSSHPTNSSGFPGQKSAQFMTTLSSVNALVDSEDLHFDVLVFGATNLARWRCHMPRSAVVPNDSHYLLFQRHAVECGCLYFWPQQA